LSHTGYNLPACNFVPQTKLYADSRPSFKGRLPLFFAFSRLPFETAPFLSLREGLESYPHRPVACA
ncbi:MAG: hypothetical protein IJ179_05675, partial [Oscillospiraceae bacterium]|nr:hypothetical protein [Oscillospiraceae bacterium]